MAVSGQCGQKDINFFYSMTRTKRLTSLNGGLSREGESVRATSSGETALAPVGYAKVRSWSKSRCGEAGGLLVMTIARSEGSSFVGAMESLDMPSYIGTCRYATPRYNKPNRLALFADIDTPIGVLMTV